MKRILRLRKNGIPATIRGIMFRPTDSTFLRCMFGSVLTIFVGPSLADPTPEPKPTSSPSPSPTPAPRVLLVEGQVFNHSGGGIEGATVTLTLKKDQSVIAESKTSEYGDIKLEAEKRIAGEAAVTIVKAHHVAATIDVMLTVDGDLPFVDHQMEGSIVLEGTVTDRATQNPIEGAEVLAKSGYKDYETKTDAKGAFKLEGILPGGLSISVKSKGYADHDVRIREAENAGLQSVRLSHERIVNLTVVDDKNQPILNVVIETVDMPHQKYRQSITNSEGRARLEGLAFDCESLKVRLTHQSKVSDIDFERTVELPMGATESDHELVMASAGILAGKIISKSGDHLSSNVVPRNGARISIGTTAQEASPKAWSDFEGMYEIPGVPSGQVVVTVHLAGHAPELKVVEVQPNKTSKLDFELKPSRSITGIVRDTEGNARPGAYIMATDWRGHSSLGLAAITDVNGAFQMLDAPHDEFKVSVYADGFKPLVDQVISSDKTAYEFTLNIDPRTTGPEMASSIKIGEDAPALSVTTLDGNELNLSELSGKVVVLDFWATWCGPCIAEIPAMIEIFKSYGDRDDVIIISISLDADKSKLRSFVKERKMNWHHVFGETGNANKAADAYGVVAIPSMFVIDAKGKIALSDGSTSAVKTVLANLLDADG